MLRVVFQGASLFLYLVRIAIFVYCILTWVAPRSGLCEGLRRFVEPFVAPFRRLSYLIMRKWGGMFDLSCLFALIGLSILERILSWLYLLLRTIF